jgi:hypothetical protein
MEIFKKIKIEDFLPVIIVIIMSTILLSIIITTVLIILTILSIFNFFSLSFIYYISNNIYIQSFLLSIIMFLTCGIFNYLNKKK